MKKLFTLSVADGSICCLYDKDTLTAMSEDTFHKFSYAVIESLCHAFSSVKGLNAEQALAAAFVEINNLSKSDDFKLTFKDATSIGSGSDYDMESDTGDLPYNDLPHDDITGSAESFEDL
jgi:hypothetical protein